MYFCLVDSYLLFCAFVATAVCIVVPKIAAKIQKRCKYSKSCISFPILIFQYFKKKRALLPPCFHALCGLERKKVGGDFHRPPPGILTSSFNYKTTFCTFTPFSVVTFTT